MLTPRQNAILRAMIREHIRTGSAVGSERIVERTRLPLSSATVRAELAFLDEAGYVFQPHTSAGRIPTPAGYRYYVDHWVYQTPFAHAATQIEKIEHAAPDMHEEKLARELAHTLAHLSGTLAVVVCHERPIIHEAGFSQLVRMRELTEGHVASDVERIVDIIEEQPRAVSALTEEVAVFINGEIPFTRTRHVSMVVTASALPSGQPLLAALIGPVRMPYNRTVGVLQALHHTFSNHVHA